MYFYISHYLGGHLGRDKTFAKIRQRYYWCNMYQSVQDFVEKCHTCQVHNSKTRNVAPEMHPVPVQYKEPWQMVAIFLILEEALTTVMDLILCIIVYLVSLIWRSISQKLMFIEI